MLEIKNIYKEIETLMNQIEGDDAVQEVKEESVAYNNNVKILLNSKDIESYLIEYEKICTQKIALLECFEAKNAQELKNYIEEKNISFDSLKIQTVQALRETVAYLIYEAEDEEY